MKQFILTIAAFLFTLSSFCQQPSSFAGTWKGMLNVGSELPIVFHIKQDKNSNWISTADSPTQGAFAIPCDTTIIDGNQVRIEMRSLRANFTGKLTNESTIEGTFTQGAGLPLVLTKDGVQKPATEKPVIDNPVIDKPVADKPVVAKPVVAKPVVAKTYRSTDIKLAGKDVTLSGTLFEQPGAGKKKAVLIIAGSGPTDRDGNSPLLPGQNNSLLDLADSLSETGIATLRYDKRGIGQSRMADGVGEEQMTIANMVDDAVLLYQWLRKIGFEQVYIAGHSEGSLIGMLATAKTDAAGFISIAGAGRPADVILKEQLNGKIPPALFTYFEKAIDSVKNGMTVTPDPALMSLLRPSVQPYMYSWLSLDPAKEIAKLKCPVLILQGSEDLQVPASDADLLHAASKRSELFVIPSMNHVLKIVSPGNQEENVRAYSDPSFLLPAKLVSLIRNFIQLM